MEIQPQLSRRQRNQQQNLSFLRVTKVKPAFLNGLSPRRRLPPRSSPTSTVRVKSRIRVKVQVMLPSMYFIFYSMLLLTKLPLQYQEICSHEEATVKVPRLYRGRESEEERSRRNG